MAPARLPYNLKRALLTAIFTMFPEKMGGGQSAPASFSGPRSAGGDLVDAGRGFQLSRSAADSFKRMADAAQGQGVDLYGINNTYRSYDQQAALWQNALQKYGSEAEARKWVAPPGLSNHNKGTAIDFSSRSAADWVANNGRTYGWANYWDQGGRSGYQANRNNKEWWHMDYLGP